MADVAESNSAVQNSIHPRLNSHATGVYRRPVPVYFVPSAALIVSSLTIGFAPYACAASDEVSATAVTVASANVLSMSPPAAQQTKKPGVKLPLVTKGHLHGQDYESA